MSDSCLTAALQAFCSFADLVRCGRGAVPRPHPRTVRSGRRRLGAARLGPVPSVRERLRGGPRELLDPLSELLDLQAEVGDGIPGIRLGAGEERLQLDLGAIAHEIEELASFR